MTNQHPSKLVPEAVRDTVIWLQEQMTEARDMLTRLQQETVESLGLLGALQAGLQEMRDRVAHQDREISTAVQLRAEVRDARETTAQLQERYSEFGQRFDEASRARETDFERERQARSMLSHRIDDLARLVDTWEQRLNVFEEAQKQYHQNLFALRQHVDELDAAHREIDGRTATLGESLQRLDARMALADDASEGLRRAADGIADRLQLTGDQLRRLEVRIDTEIVPELGGINSLHDDLRVIRAERERWETQVQRFEGRVNDYETLSTDQIGQSQRFRVRTDGLDNRLAQMEEQLAEFREQVAARLQQLGQTQERQKRRQMEDLEREIRELKQYATRLVEE